METQNAILCVLVAGQGLWKQRPRSLEGDGYLWKGEEGSSKDQRGS